MKKPFTDRVHAEFRDRVSPTRPIVGRKYTMTHSDDTAELFVTIGLRFAKDKFGDIRDEVLLEFKNQGHQLQLMGSVLINSEEMQVAPQMRNQIFLREMPTALQAIRYADRQLFERFPMLDQIPVKIWFQSTDEKYNKLYDFGPMKEYKIS